MLLRLFTIVCLFALTSSCVSFSAKQRELVKQAAIAQIGVKYKYGGYTPATGFDCSGLVYYIYHKQLGYSLPRTVKGLQNHTNRVFFFKKKGDLLFFNIGYRWYKPWTWFRANHVGIYIGNNTMIHAPSTGKRITIVQDVFNNAYWSRYYKYTKRVIK